MKRTTALLIVTLIASVGSLVAQPETVPTPLPELPPFYFDLLSFASESTGVSRLDVYLDVPYEVLQFTKEGSGFRAQYEATVTLFDSSKKQVSEKFWRDVIETSNFDETTSPRAGKLTQKTFLIPPGKYDVQVQVRDNETQKSAQRLARIDVKNYRSAPFMISDPMLVSRLSTEDGKSIVYPNISGNVGDLSDGVNIFFEAYNRTEADSALLILRVKDKRAEVAMTDTTVQSISHPKRSILPWLITSKLVAGDYMLQIEATPFRGKRDSIMSSLTVTDSRPFTIRWRGVPASIVDLDAAISQLVYMIGKDEVDKMKEGTAEEHREKWTAFWKSKDPSPGSLRNELMEEYYARVEYANKHFGHHAEGWRTDMGMVYIIFGPPSNIDRHPFDINSKPYEVWTYYELNREFVFIDQTGFGEYRLQTPIWDVWRTRPR